MAPERELIDDMQIMKLIRERNRTGLEILYDQFACTLYGIICKITTCDKEAEDVLKNTFILAWNNHSDFNEANQSFSSWLTGIARNLAKKCSSNKPVSKNQKGFFFVDSKQLLREIETEPGENALLMSGEQKKVLELVYFKGVKINEIAKEMDIPVDRAKQLLREAVNFYRKEPQKA